MVSPTENQLKQVETNSTRENLPLVPGQTKIKSDPNLNSLDDLDIRVDFENF